MTSISYTKAKQFEGGKPVGWTTSIHPIPPFFLFVPSIDDIPKEVMEKEKDKSFALGEFFDTDEQALKEVKESGYTQQQLAILEEQGYVRLKKKLKGVV